MDILLNCITDVALVIYGLIILVSFSGGGLFVWWWIRIHRASEVYAYITFLMFSIGYANIFNFFARYQFVACDSFDGLESILNHFTWKLKGLPILIILLLIVLRMTMRVRITLEVEKRAVDIPVRSALLKLLNIFEVICEEIRASLSVARIAFSKNDIEKGCLKAMEIYAGSKKLEKAVSEFCKEVKCEQN